MQNFWLLQNLVKILPFVTVFFFLIYMEKKLMGKATLGHGAH